MTNQTRKKLAKKKQIDLKSQVLNLFEYNPSLSVKFNLLVKKLKINKGEKALLRDALRDLTSSKELVKNGKYYEVFHREKMYEGKVVLDKEMEYAVEVHSAAGFERLKVKKRNLQTALVNDIVEVSIVEYADKEYKEAIVERIIKREKHRIVGKLEFSHGSGDYAFVIPDDKKFRKDIYVPKKLTKAAQDGDKVVVEITNWEYQDLSPEGKVVSILGKAGEVKTEFKALIKKYGLNKTFPKTVTEEVKKLERNGLFEVTGEEIQKRMDLRDKTIFTIDPVTAKDFDDAVSLEFTENGNYYLGVHIADVSHYVREGTELDTEALARGTSVYLMNDVVPMLPEKLSNDVCSLKEGVERLTFSVFMEIDKKGNILDNVISKSVIKSKKRFTYQEVQEIINKQEGDFLEEINNMNELHKILIEKRKEEGSLDFETREVDAEIVKGIIKSIKPKDRLESMRLIEDFMLAANKSVTLFINRMNPRPPFVYRIHDIPDKKKIRELSYFVKQFGINLNPDSKESIQEMLEQIRGKDEEYLINGITIRSMSKAIYSEENIGHYGLGFSHYTHFTSPIRRYPDLIVHRIIFEVLNKIDQKKTEHYRSILPEVCKQSTDMEINAVNAEREAIKILQIQYLEKHLGDEFTGIISGVSEYGIYVELTDTLIEGMVRLRDLKDDYYILDEKNYRLKGRHRGKSYRLGDRVKVVVHKTNKENKWIDFLIVD